MPEIDNEQMQKAKLRAIEVLEQEIADIDAAKESNKTLISDKRKLINGLENDIETLKERNEELSNVRKDIETTLGELKKEKPQSASGKRMLNIIKATFELAREE